MSDELDYRRVITKSYKLLIEDMEPIPILDQFEEHDFLPSTVLRDIKELRTTSEKNRDIIKSVLNKGVSGYRNFKKFLCDAKQGHLADRLDSMEKKEDKEDHKSKPNDD